MDTNEIELRSEWVRHIIGKIPPWLIRSGISLVATLIVALLIIAWFVPYPESLEVKVQARSEDEVVGYVPYSYITQLKEGMSVAIAFEGYDARVYGYVKSRVLKIEKEVMEEGDRNYFIITIQPYSYSRIEIKENMQGNAFILLTNKSILKHIGGVFFFE